MRLKIILNDFSLTFEKDTIWLWKDDGEGMKINEVELYCILQKFWDKNY